MANLFTLNIQVKNEFKVEVFTAGDPFVQFLNDRRHKIFYLRPFLGNSGDELIYLGAEQLLADLGIKVSVDPRLAEVILWPGGNPTMWETSISACQYFRKLLPNEPNLKNKENSIMTRPKAVFGLKMSCEKEPKRTQSTTRLEFSACQHFSVSAFD